MKRLFFSSIVIAGFLVSCTSQTPKSSTSTTANLPATAENLAQGKTIYENNCGKCHALPNPAKYTDEKWVGIMNWMAPKAKLDDNQKALAFAYVTNSN